MKMKAGFLFAGVPHHRAPACLSAAAELSLNVVVFTFCSYFPTTDDDEAKMAKKKENTGGGPGASWFCGDAFTLIRDGATGAGGGQLAARPQLRCH